MQLKNAVEIGDFCRSAYIYWPLSSNKRLVFDEVIKNVKGGDVLDLGCGEAGLYWALGYANKASRIDMIDISTEVIEDIKQQLEELSPEYLKDNFQETLNYLNVDDEEQLAVDIIENINAVQTEDFRSTPITDTLYDTVLCLESLQVAKTQDDLNEIVRGVSQRVKNGGQILGINWRYDVLDDQTRALIKFGSFGFLNPTEKQLEAAFTSADLKIEKLDKVDTPEIHNFSQAIIFHVTKAGV